MIAAALYVPYKFWRQTRFAEALSDDEIRASLGDQIHPRHAQHALVQISQRLNQDPRAARPFADLLVPLAKSPRLEIRSTLAWLLGQGERAEESHALLKSLSEDSEPSVRYNAALSLSAFGDRGARPLLREMLSPYQVRSPVQGILVDSVAQGKPLAVGTALAVIRDDSGEELRVPAPLGGKILAGGPALGSKVALGETLGTIAPSMSQIWEALRALVLVGGKREIPLVEALLNNPDNYGPRILDQARETLKALKKRS